ncbi:MAG: DUF3667 domain-containing protein [Polaribacter sp.]
MNCGHPFTNKEKFCPECGQANKGSSITFANFIHEIFNGLFNFDAKFWNTIIPLLIQPGVVSKNYVAGKRQRYSNPFRFYLTVSIIFFLILGITKSVDKFKSLAKTTKADVVKTIKNEEEKRKKKRTQKEIDSIKQDIDKRMRESFIPIPEKARKKLLEEIEKDVKDTTKTVIGNDGASISFVDSSTRLDKYIQYQKEHPKTDIDTALDSLKEEKTFFNRFLYNRAQVVNSFVDKKESREQFFNQLLSYGSVALFFFLPIFTLFLKLFYIRRKYTYVDHLVFVFHTQTVFFMLLSIYYLLELFGAKPKLWIFILLFVIYLFIAMKKFYQQGYFKTLIKFFLLNFSYMIIATVGVLAVLLISFALY